MSTDLFGMAVENRKSIPELIIVGSQRIDSYPLLEAARNFIKPLIFDNVQLISLDKTFINGLIVCKHCHMLFTDTRWNRPVFLKHLTKFHGIEHKEPKPEPTIPKQPKKNPIQFTETPVTITLMEPNTKVTEPPTESGKPNEEVAKAVATSEAVRKSHHKKKVSFEVRTICADTISVPTTLIPVISQRLASEECVTIKEEWPQAIPIPVQPICADTISVPATPLRDVSEEWVRAWEAPLENKPSTLKRKAVVPKETGGKALTKKKTSKKPKLNSEEHEQKPPIPILHLHLKPPRAIKPRVKQPERKE